MDQTDKSAQERKTIDIDSVAENLRSKSIVGNNQFLISRFTNSSQEKDLFEGSNCQGFGRIHHFKFGNGDDWLNDPLPHKVAAWKLGLPFHPEERVQIFQNAACNCRCWYCFVDYKLLSASKLNSDFKTADDLLDLFLQENNRPHIIDLSGGQPDIIPEWPVRMMEALIRRKLDDRFYVWLDDNLTTYNAWKYLTDKDFDVMRNFKNFGRVGCFKGFSPESFHENTGASPDIFERQIDIMSKWVDFGVDIYGYITLTSSNLNGFEKSLIDFMDDVQEKIHPNFLLRIVPLKIVDIYTPVEGRIDKKTTSAIKNQFKILALWKTELEKRYSKKERESPIYSLKIN